MTAGRIAIYRKPIPDWAGARIIGEYDIEGVQYSFRTRAEGGGLWVNWLAASGRPGNAQRWHEQYCGNPGNLRIVEAYGTIVVDRIRPYCFVKAGDGALWVCYLLDRKWHWNSLGLPPDGVSLVAPMGALTVKGAAPYCFVLGSDDDVWLNWWNEEAQRHEWLLVGRPEGARLSSLGTIATDEGRAPHLFAMAGDGAVWEWQPQLLEWATLGKPDAAALSAPMGVTLTQNMGRDALSVFALGEDGKLYLGSPPGGLGLPWSPVQPPPGPLGNFLAARTKDGRPNIFIGRSLSFTPPANTVREPDIYCWAGQGWQAITFPEDMIETRVGWNQSGRIALLAVGAERVWTAYEGRGQWDWSSLPLETSQPVAKRA